MKMLPIPGYIIVEPEDRAEQIAPKHGLVIAEPKFQGPPNIGTIYQVAEGEDTFAVGMRVVFKEEHPKGFKWDDRTLFRLDRDQIILIINQLGEES